jgi:formylglycine-generating enzyme required for sulfatase activity
MSGDKKLRGVKSRRFREALLDAFPTRDLLEQMVRVGLGENLEVISADENLSVTVFDLLTWAESRGKVDDLLACARQANPGNELLHALANEIEGSTAPGDVKKVPLAHDRAFFVGSSDSEGCLHDDAVDKAPASPAGSTGLLSHDEILKLYSTVLAAQLAGSRSTLLVGIDPTIAAGIPSASNPRDQILMDLGALNTVTTLANVQKPLEIWLANATVAARGMAAEPIFCEALEKCGGVVAPRPVAGPARPPRSRWWILLPVAAAALALALAAVWRSKAPVPQPPDLGIMILIPGGKFEMGSREGPGENDHGLPRHEETVATFYLDKTEVTVEAYSACVEQHKCDKPPTKGACNWDKTGRERHPINCVDWDQAKSFCKWLGKRLPLEKEWEYAERGPENRKYPWGSGPPTGQLCWSGAGEVRESTCPVGSHDGGDTPLHVQDMAGNLCEWVEDAYHCSPSTVGCFDSAHASRVLRGSDWNDTKPEEVSGAYRSWNQHSTQGFYIGFRCARDE